MKKTETFPEGDYTVEIILSRYRTWAAGRMVYQAHVASLDGLYSHFGDDPGIVTDWMNKRDRPREVVSEHETKEYGRFEIHVDGVGIISILREVEKS